MFFAAAGELFVLAPDGRVIAETRYPAAGWGASFPLVRDDHVAILTSRGHILAMDQTGATLWHSRRVGAARGTATQGDGILLEDGLELRWWAPDGTSRPVWIAPEPILTTTAYHGGAWYVATTRNLFRLESR